MQIKIEDKHQNSGVAVADAADHIWVKYIFNINLLKAYEINYLY